jgi:hypothetical protein
MVKHDISGDQIPEDVVETVIALGVKKIMVDEVFGIEGTTNLKLGYRSFYLKL